MERNIHRLVRFFKCPVAERHLLLKTWAILWSFRLALWILPFRYFKRFLENQEPRTEKISETDVIQVQRVVWAIQTTSRHVPNGRNCLLKAISASYLLRRLGYPSELHIGVNRSDVGELDAHAWIVFNGEVIIGDLQDLSQFNALLPKGRKPS